MGRDVWIEFEKTDIALDLHLHGAASDWADGKTGPATAAGGVGRPEQRAGHIGANACRVEPGFEAFLGLVIHGHQPFLSALAVDFNDFMSTTALAVVNSQGRELLHTRASGNPEIAGVETPGGSVTVWSTAA